MANIPLKTIKFPGLSDTYTIPDPTPVDATLANPGQAADAKKVGDELSDLKQDLTELDAQINGGDVVVPTAKLISDFTLESWYIATSSGKWVNQSNRGYFIAIPSNCRKITLVGKENASHPQYAYSEYACLANINFVADQVAPLVGASLPSVIAGGQTAEIATIDGSNYFYVRRLNGDGSNIEPTSIIFYLAESSEDSIVGQLSNLQDDVTELHDDVTELQAEIDDIDVIKNNAPFVYTLENKTIVVSTGEISASNKTVLSDIFLAKAGTSITTDAGYGFRFVYYNSAESTTPSAASDWVTEYTFDRDRYVRFHGRYSFNVNVNITPESITPHISENVGLDKTYIGIASVAQLSEYKKYNPLNLNEVLYNNEDMIWTWWTYPQAVHFERVRDKLYWIFTTRGGYSGVASYDFNSKQTTKTMLKKTGTDDHNAPAVFVRSNGHIIVAYSGGHNTDRYMHIRHSLSLESIEHFEDEVLYESWSNTCYAQIFEYNSNIYIFYRMMNNKWMYIKSTDGGYTWQDETMVIDANMQYYCKVTPTTTDGVLRLIMYSNPTEPDPRIRMGFIHLDTGKIYNTDNSTELGTSDIPYTSFTVLWELDDPSSKPYQRLFDVAITAPSSTRILYAQFSDDESGDAIYTMYDNGTKVAICPAGTAIWIPKYQCGCAFINPDKIVVAYNDDGKDYITLWDYATGTFTKTKTVYDEPTGTLPIRNARPIVDITGEYILWHRGYYRSNSFTDFVTDAKLYSITDDEILL